MPPPGPGTIIWGSGGPWDYYLGVWGPCLGSYPVDYFTILQYQACLRRMPTGMADLLCILNATGKVDAASQVHGNKIGGWGGETARSPNREMWKGWAKAIARSWPGVAQNVNNNIGVLTKKDDTR